MKSFFKAVFTFLLVISPSACSNFLMRDSNTYIQYPVQPGDTLSAISNRFRVSVADLQSINDIGDPRSLAIGRTLNVPYNGQDLGRKERDVASSSNSNSNRASYSGKNKGDIGSSSSKGVKQVNLGQAGEYVGRLYFPVNSADSRVNSSFGWRWLNFHEGIDIAAKEGTSIYAAHDGTVVYSGDGIRGYGNIVLIKGENILTVYGHNKRNRVSKGERVRKGEHIADLGMTGKASGPHLHFEIRIKNKSGRFAAVDPLAFFP